MKHGGFAVAEFCTSLFTEDLLHCFWIWFAICTSHELICCLRVWSRWKVLRGSLSAFVFSGCVHVQFPHNYIFFKIFSLPGGSPLSALWRTNQFCHHEASYSLRGFRGKTYINIPDSWITMHQFSKYKHNVDVLAKYAFSVKMCLKKNQSGKCCTLKAGLVVPLKHVHVTESLSCQGC